MSNIPKPNEIYQHFKGGLYKIVTMASDSETGADVVVYQALYGEFKVYVRELSMFMSKVDRTKYPEASQEYRFVLQTDIIGQSAAETQQIQEHPIQEQPEPEQTQPEPELPKQTQTPPEREADLPEAEPALEDVLDPMLMQFLEADTYEEQLNILVGLHHRMTDDILNTIAASLDVEINEGSIEERYAELKTCLLTLEKYERSRP